MQSVIFKCFKEIGKFALVFILLFTGLYGFAKYKMYSVESFCENVSLWATQTSIIEQAKIQGLIIDVEDKREVLWVLNQRSPFWRFACKIHFHNEQVVKKDVVVAY